MYYKLQIYLTANLPSSSSLLWRIFLVISLQLGMQNYWTLVRHVEAKFSQTGMPSLPTRQQPTLELKTVLSAQLSSYISQHRKLEAIPNPLYNLSHCSPSYKRGASSAISLGYNPVYMPPTKIFFLMY